MEIGWIDFSEKDRKRAIDVLHLLNEGAVDELGIGVVRDVFADYFFPGEMSDTDHFRKTVDEVNIGAFPMRQGDIEHEMLRSFIADLMRQNAIEIVEQVIPQKGLYYTTEPTANVQPRNVYTGIVRATDAYLQEYKDHKAKEYIIDKTSIIGVLGAKYLLPMVVGKIDGYYQIRGLKVTDEGDARVVLRLGEFIPLGEDKVNIYDKMRPNELISLQEVKQLYYAILHI